MKTVKKYSSFQDLKSAESKPVDPEVSLKKHTAFEKFIQSILSQKNTKASVNTSSGR